MFKLLIASGVAVSAAVLASPAQADWYVNPELNVGVGLDSGVGSGILEGHVGYDFDNGAYVQAGPAVVFPDAGSPLLEVRVVRTRPRRCSCGRATDRTRPRGPGAGRARATLKTPQRTAV